ncbi:beta-ketoacyl-ACP synthase III [Chondrinema litorale]|uniref:beta-ketoacyl-ACP synthase III n=1 Tax=Chondrinema litorale TaxID=2994555 RepID=UPI0025434FB0|nr:beta-ketoacyl-ACP synthase III [Chondrinema litorale]UZR97315.1 ketoacyl-ACP synthase III [Chondrinema litorale]
MNAKIDSIGVYVPENKIDNTYFEKILDTSHEWISSRTGINTRYFANENEYTSDLSMKAIENLVENYDKDLSDVDFIIVATSTPDQVMPSTASQIQYRLGIKNAGCLDLSAACAGFTYGVILAKGLIATSAYKKVLVIGAETLSKVCDYTDRATCILFGDGAGAVLVEASESNHLYKPLTATDGAHGKDLYLSQQPAPVSGEVIDSNGKVHQTGRVVFKWAVGTLTQKLEELATLNNTTFEAIDWLIPHSANIRILEAVCSNLDIPTDKCLESVRNFGNTSAASIPLAWHSGIESGKIKLNDELLLAGFGGGLTFSGICLNNQIEKK